MTDSPSTHRPRRRIATMTAAATAVLLAASFTPVTGAAAGPSTGPGSAQASRAATAPANPARTVGVMTRNLYLGADLTPIITALATPPTDPSNPLGTIPQVAKETWDAVRATKPRERMGAIADEIAAKKPSVVGLQEVTVWKTYPIYPADEAAGTVKFDFLDLLLDALAKRGLQYREVKRATADNFASPQVPMLTGTGLGAVSLSDRDVIIKRVGVRTANARNGSFDTIVTFPTGLGPLPVARGWGSVDVSVKRANFRFVNSHLEAFDVPGGDAELVRQGQVAELLAAQKQLAERKGMLPTAYVGDYNTAAPSAPAYTDLLAGVGRDAWTVLRGSKPGNTCCFDAAVKDAADPLTSRIDLVLVTKRMTVKGIARVGEDPKTDLTRSGLWPSDHAGVAARLLIRRWPAR